MAAELPDFGDISFSGELRHSQKAATSVIIPQLKVENKRLHIVAPPGSGKTVLGLYVWAELVRKPTLVLSPNSAIQAQWAARTSLFDLDGKDSYISTNPKSPGLLTSLTYQSVTLPQKGGEDLDAAALELWAEKLIAEGEADDHESAEAWQNDLRERNSKYFKSRISSYRKRAREEISREGDILATLHKSAKENLRLLKEAGIGLIILDECHHLMHHWGRILSEIREMFDDPYVLGLTATPPEGDSFKAEDVKRYTEFFGPVDYEVPVPALVRDSNLAPYQDLCYFVRPAPHELEYIARVDEEFDELLEELRTPDAEAADGRVPSLDEWVFTALDERKSPGGKSEDWSRFQSKNKVFADDARRFLQTHGIELPAGIPRIAILEDDQSWTRMSMLRTVLDRYVRHGLRRSQSSDDHALSESVVSRLRLLGIQITETGSRPCASPVGRVMAYASAKVDALNEIIAVESEVMGEDIRVVVVTDFEKTSATALVEGVLDDEAGGAIAVFRALVSHPAGDTLDPILMTGSTVLVDDELIGKFLSRAEEWVGSRNLEIEFEDIVHDGYHEIRGKGKNWIPRYYSLMITEFFQEGLTRCIVGTRGLLGEGWDASRINVLIDMTTVTTSMSINQLRGRSIRLDSMWPEKVANNWDIICLAEEFTKGFDDYERFKRKHQQLYGVCDDGTIEKGVGHVHAAFNDARPEGISEGMTLFNEEMLKRSQIRPHTRELWGIGQPFAATSTTALEAKLSAGFGSGFNFGKDKKMWTDTSLVEAFSRVIVYSLKELGEIDSDSSSMGGDRGGGWLRYHLHDSTEEEAELFSTSLEELLGPLKSPRYVISRSSRFMEDTWLSKMMPEILARFLRKTRTETVMYHTVPSCLASSKDRAMVFQKHWNQHIGPSELRYGRSATGKQFVETVRQSGMGPKVCLHSKQVFL
ncbi:MAG: DEAD/DEAH box helicase family protein [Candidatus Poseidoniaceae archaeon]|nr:DEAD/DEAH box helicase family protein [Candidatus Poseidoniaceae archaeon]